MPGRWRYPKRLFAYDGPRLHNFFIQGPIFAGVDDVNFAGDYGNRACVENVIMRCRIDPACESLGDDEPGLPKGA